MQFKINALGWAALATLTLAGSQAIAQCQSCQSGSTTVNGAWPGHVGGVQGQSGDWRAEASQRAKKIEDRNRAWMRPFNCQDRVAYHAAWAPMVQSGWINQCTLDDSHFDEAGKLNNIGEKKVAAIMMNFPADQRMVLIAPHRDTTVVDARLDDVRGIVNRWYGAEMAARVDTTNKVPLPFSGNRVQAINARYMAQLPSPTIATASSSGSSGSGSQGSGSSSGGSGTSQ